MENLCEALRNLQDLQQSDAAKMTGARLATAAEAFARAEPGHIGAVYYLAKARFRLLQPSLVTVTDRNRQQVCQQLASLLQPVDAVLAREQQQPAALWQRYTANYRLLKGEVSSVQHALLKCP